MPKHRALSAQSLGARLAELRQAAGLTQVQLAEALGISQRMLSHYESLEDHSLAKLLRLMSQRLGVSADALLGLEVSKPRPASRQRLPRSSSRPGKRKPR